MGVGFPKGDETLRYEDENEDETLRYEDENEDETLRYEIRITKYEI